MPKAELPSSTPYDIVGAIEEQRTLEEERQRSSAEAQEKLPELRTRIAALIRRRISPPTPESLGTREIFEVIKPTQLECAIPSRYNREPIILTISASAYPHENRNLTPILFTINVGELNSYLVFQFSRISIISKDVVRNEAGAWNPDREATTEDLDAYFNLLERVEDHSSKTDFADNHFLYH